ncbi:bifunctional protein-serine/threonine kinase/phosphatase [Thalassotalea sp. G2M2-11]|uniref:bifunctional protein-serine/threonine kinase/phosphatase n=1 Tax=Thalassotalea sp. G2M2-11 TaxID=2787627 RepID=UPI0019D0928C|nr:bifunctional protein-serine/threonine kinase/phosphatase [Thalassotalea sp. G2M2-11]
MSAKSAPIPAQKQAPKNTTAILQLCFGGYSHQGCKPENQDAFVVNAPQSSKQLTKGAIAAIADGVSSANHAAQAAQLAVTQFSQEFYATPPTWSTKKSAVKVLTSLNQWLYGQASTLFSQANSHHNSTPQWLTTFSTIILKSATGYIFHVGDTRISRFRQEEYEVLTRDHNRKQGGKHLVLTRALGADSRIKVDFQQIDLQADDLILLTCDGVHEFVEEKQLATIVQQLPKCPTTQALESASQQITAQAIDNGSDDNVSCLLVYIRKTAKRDLVEIERDIMSKAIPPALKEGMKLDGYTVHKVIHASIRSHLYLVEAPETNEKLILKTPSQNFEDDTIYLQGFIREAWVGERINHPRIMKVKTDSQHSQFLYHVCEYIDGQTLADWMHDNPKPSIAQVRSITWQIITALRAFQRLEIVHRDLKPDNIMIDRFGCIKLIDYGTARIASLEESADHIEEAIPQGSLNYIAPETLLLMESSNISDLFSLGVICYQMLCGELPFKPMQRAQVTQSSYDDWQYRSIRQFRSDLPFWLDLALQQCTHPDPKQRYQAFSEFHQDLTKPNIDAVAHYKNQPILARNPVKFWQSTSAILLLLLLISLAL